jgi:Ni,Fe-hydrogenase I small subunit
VSRCFKIVADEAKPRLEVCWLLQQVHMKNCCCCGQHTLDSASVPTDEHMLRVF